MKATAFRLSVSARWSEIDANQHVRNTAYSEWATFARSEWLASLDYDFQKLMEMDLSAVILEDSTRYVKEIFLGEEIAIVLELAGLSSDRTRFRVRHTFLRGDRLCAVHDVLGAWVNLSSRRLAAPPSPLFDVCSKLERTLDYAEFGSGLGDK